MYIQGNFLAFGYDNITFGYYTYWLGNEIYMFFMKQTDTFIKLSTCWTKEKYLINLAGRVNQTSSYQVVNNLGTCHLHILVGAGRIHYMSQN